MLREALGRPPNDTAHQVPPLPSSPSQVLQSFKKGIMGPNQGGVSYGWVRCTLRPHFGWGRNNNNDVVTCGLSSACNVTTPLMPRPGSTHASMEVALSRIRFGSPHPAIISHSLQEPPEKEGLGRR